MIDALSDTDPINDLSEEKISYQKFYYASQFRTGCYNHQKEEYIRKDAEKSDDLEKVRHEYKSKRIQNFQTKQRIWECLQALNQGQDLDDNAISWG